MKNQKYTKQKNQIGLREIRGDEYDNRQCKNLVVWRRNANTGEEYKFHPDKLDGNILIVTCAAAQSWFMGEIVDGKKWDGERKVVVYEVKGQ